MFESFLMFFFVFFVCRELWSPLIYQVCWGRISNLKRGREVCREEYHVGIGKKYPLPFNIKAVGKNIKWRREEEALKFLERKSRFKNGSWGEISSCTFLVLKHTLIKHSKVSRNSMLNKRLKESIVRSQFVVQNCKGVWSHH